MSKSIRVVKNDSLKMQMMKLWKDTFHDSDDYVNLIFENYFNPDLVECEIIDGRVVAMLLAIPYSFLFKNNLEKSEIHCDNKFLKALYLCGLAVEPKYRGNAIMAKLIDKFESRNYRNFDFMFLIPANSKLLNYYKKIGWEIFSYKNKKYLNEIDFIENELCENIKIEKMDFENIKFEFGKHNNDKFKITNKGKFENIFRYFSKSEVNSHNSSVIHSFKDFKIIIEENSNANGEIYVAYQDNKVCGIAFAEKTGTDKILIKHLYYDSKNIAYQFLINLKNLNPNFIVEIYYFDSQSIVFGKGERFPYTMIKNFKPSENLKFADFRPFDSKNQILVKNGISQFISLSSPTLSMSFSDLHLPNCYNGNNTLNESEIISFVDIMSGSPDVSLMLD